MKELFPIEATKNEALPIGGGLWVAALHPSCERVPPYKEWTFSGDIIRMPEFTAPALGNKPNNLVTIDTEILRNADGVLYALGGFSGDWPPTWKTATLSTNITCSRFIARRSRPENFLPGRRRSKFGPIMSNRSLPVRSRLSLKVNGKEVVPLGYRPD